MNVIDITITSVAEATYDDYNNVLVLRFDNGTSVRVEGRALDAVKDALPSGSTDVADLKDSVATLRSELESAQSEVNSRVDDAESGLADAESALGELRSIADCHSDLGSALDALEQAVSDLDRG